MYFRCALNMYHVSHGGFNDPSVTRHSDHYENDWVGRIEI